MIRQLLFIFCVFLSSVTLAAELELKASSSASVVSIGQRFRVSYSIDASASEFHAPSFSGFRILAGPNQSRSMQYINGRMSASSTWSFVLLAENEGVYTLSPASVIVDGNTIESNALEIRVVNTSSTPSSAAPSQSNPTPSQNRNKSNDQQEINTNDKVFIRAIVDKRNAYVGEKITAVYKLYTRVGIADNSLENLPALNGFWSQDIKSLYDDANWNVEIINGRRYNSAILMNSLLYPQRSGKLIVDPMSMKMQVQVAGSGNSLFDRMFGTYETKEIIVESNKIEINVSPLPSTGKPQQFSGAVGSFNMKREFSTHDLKANEALNLKITVSGKGNLQLLDAPELNLPADFEVYEPEIKDNFKVDQNGISGSRSFEYLIIPRHEGTYTIEPYSFSYFDLASEDYKTILSDSIKITVAAPDKNANQVYTSVNKEEVELLNKDIAYIHEDDLDLRSNKKGFYGSFLFYILMLLPLLSIASLFFLKKKYQEKKEDLVGLRRNKAKKIAKKRLTTAKKHLDSGDKTSFHEEISAALYGYYSDKFNFSLSELSQEKIIATMHDRGADENLTEKLKEVLEEAEMARFAPPSELDDQAMYKKAENVIITSEEELS